MRRRTSPGARPCLVAMVAAVLATAACAPDSGRTPVQVASTTSLYDTGLLDSLQAAFQRAEPAYELHTVAVGTGEALKLGERKDADLVIVHAPEAEQAFLDAGHGLRRTTFMRNDFVIAGPAGDPAGVANATGPADAFRRISDAGAEFASRGDDSGTHIRERMIWAELGRDPAADRSGSGDWYLEVGQGMGATLLFAGERQAYVLTDRATLTTLRANGIELEELYAGGDLMVNVYSVIPVADAAQPAGAAAFEAFLLGPAATEIIRAYGAERYGRALFTPLDD